MKRPIVLFTLFMLSLGAYAQDIRSNTEGFSVSGNLSYIHWSSTELNQLDEQEPNGVGGGLRVGYGLNQRFELFVGIDGYSFALNLPDEWTAFSMGSFCGGLRVNLGGTLQPIRPYVEVGYAGQSFTIDPIVLNNGDPTLYELRMNGSALIASTGINYFLTQKLALNASVGGSLGKMNSFLLNDVGFTDRPDVRTLRATVGVSFFFH